MSTMLRGAIYGLTAAAIWGAMYIISDIVLQTIPPFTLLAIRLGMAVVILALPRRGLHRRRPNRREILELLGVGLIGYGISVGAQFVGTDRSTGVNGALITSASPAFILVFAALILRERLTAQRLAAVALATVGVIVIIDPTKADFSSAAFFGNIALAVAALTWGLYSVLVRRASARLDTTTVSFYALVGGWALTIPAAALEMQTRPIGAIDADTILGVFYLGVVSTAAAMWLWNRAFALVDASVASLFFFAQPLVGAALGVALGQQLTPQLIAGGLMIGLGVLVSMIAPERLSRRFVKSAPQRVET
ncbi:MAG: EamA family transporter [Chloroflexi bacterium]|nr:EamA family transporter [Chloroflexota bacterium]